MLDYSIQYDWKQNKWWVITVTCIALWTCSDVNLNMLFFLGGPPKNKDTQKTHLDQDKIWNNDMSVMLERGYQTYKNLEISHYYFAAVHLTDEKNNLKSILFTYFYRVWPSPSWTNMQNIKSSGHHCRKHQKTSCKVAHEYNQKTNKRKQGCLLFDSNNEPCHVYRNSLAALAEPRVSDWVTRGFNRRSVFFTIRSKSQTFGFNHVVFQRWKVCLVGGWTNHFEKY